MVRVIYDMDVYEGYAAARTDTDIYIYDENWREIRHISGIYGDEWNYVSIEGGDWLAPEDVPNAEDLLLERIKELESLANNAKGLVGYLSVRNGTEEIYPQLVGTLSPQNGSEESYPMLIGTLSIPVHYGEKYDGSYEIMPTPNFQLVPTMEKYMENDILVHPIPYAEVSNLSGGYTATIGG